VEESDPIEPPESSAEVPAIDPDATTVLVVDDEAAHLASIEKILVREGMRALTADSARAAIELVRKHRVHVVLTDLMMPANKRHRTAASNQASFAGHRSGCDDCVRHSGGRSAGHA